MHATLQLSSFQRLLPFAFIALPHPHSQSAAIVEMIYKLAPCLEAIECGLVMVHYM
jgi:hypothetical protein